MKWGIVDTVTGWWLGDYAGERAFDSMTVAYDVLTLASRRLGYHAGRLVVKQLGDETVPELLETISWRN